MKAAPLGPTEPFATLEAALACLQRGRARAALVEAPRPLRGHDEAAR